MNDAPIQIRNPEVVRALRRLAAKKGKPITDTVGELVGAELSRIDRVDDAEVQRRLKAARRIVAEFNALPVVGPLLTDDDLYDEDGLPK
jgi:hypothetical protein